jgi:hypothetical protein
MRLLLVLLLPNTIFSQQAYDLYKIVDSLKPQTRAIMEYLNVPMRKNIRLDGRFSFVVDSSLPVYMAEFRTFQSEDRYRLDSKFPWARYYSFPIIAISPKMDSIFKNIKIVGRVARVFAFSAIVHELCHFYQKTFLDNPLVVKEHASPEDKVQYMNQPTEREAYLVGAFYYLQEVQPSIIDQILGDKQYTQEKQRQLIIDAYLLSLR